MLTRYIVTANGEKVFHAETKEKAWRFAHKYEDECFNQDIPCYPKMEVTKETIS